MRKINSSIYQNKACHMCLIIYSIIRFSGQSRTSYEILEHLVEFHTQISMEIFHMTRCQIKLC